jgi:hypothetical protein
MRGWNFFEVPRLSLARQSLKVDGGKLRNGWPLVLRHSFRLLRRFRPNFK